MEKYKALRNDNEIFLNFIEEIFKGNKNRDQKMENIDLNLVTRLRNSSKTNKEIADHLGLSEYKLRRIVYEFDLPKRRNDKWT